MDLAYSSTVDSQTPDPGSAAATTEQREDHLATSKLQERMMRERRENHLAGEDRMGASVHIQISV